MEATGAEATSPSGMFLWQGSQTAFSPNEGHVPQYALYVSANDTNGMVYPNQQPLQQVVWIPMSAVLPSPPSKETEPSNGSKGWSSDLESDLEDGVGYPTGVIHPPKKSVVVSTIEASWKWFWGGVLELILLLLVVYWIAAMNLKEKDRCLSADGSEDLCYCEKLSSGLVREPVNTYSALGFSLGGLVMTAKIGQGRLPPAINRMTSQIFFAACYFYLAVFLGPGSMMFHISLTALGGFMDTASMFLWLGFIFVYDIIRLFRMSSPKLVGTILYIVLEVVLNGLQLAIGGTFMFGVLVGLALGIEFVVYLRSQTVASWSYYKYLIKGLFTFVVAFVIWNFSRTGEPLCFPDSLIQGHAIWHLLCALCVYQLYTYFQVARDPEPFN